MYFFPYWFAIYEDQVSVLTCLFSEHAPVCFFHQFLFIFSVILAKVLSQEEKNDTGIFDLEILQTFKGTSRLNQTAGILFYGFERGLFAKSYTEKCSSMCGVWLADGTVYLLSGYIQERKLQLSQCDLIKKWSKVTPSQRVGISRFYGQNCECRISPCYGNACPKLEGCHGDWEKWRYPYCVKNADETACSWCETAECNKCTSKAANVNIVLSYSFYCRCLLLF